MLIQNACLFTMEKHGVLENCDLRVAEGKIAEIGRALPVGESPVLDASGLCVLPGLIDAHTHSGAYLFSGLSDHTEAIDPVTPQLSIRHSIDINNPAFKLLVQKGITSCCFIPGSKNVICGSGFVGKTWGKQLQKMVLLDPAVMKCAMGGNPKNHYGSRNQAPATRMGIASLLRETLSESRLYLEKKQKAAADGTKQPEYNAKWEAMLPVLNGEIPLKVHCEQFDMLTVIDIAKEFGCRYTLEHAWACDLYAEELIAGGGSVMFGPIGIPEGYGEVTGGDVGLVKCLDERGLNVCLITDSPILGADLLLISAGEAVRRGVEHLRALAMITINPAKGLGVEQRVGSLKPGKDADLAIFEGVPALDMGARLRYTIVDGQVAYQA